LKGEDGSLDQFFVPDDFPKRGGNVVRQVADDVDLSP
jgi:hypothetical protein